MMRIDTSSDHACEPTFEQGQKDGSAGFWPRLSAPAIYHEGYASGSRVRTALSHAQSARRATVRLALAVGGIVGLVGASLVGVPDRLLIAGVLVVGVAYVVPESIKTWRCAPGEGKKD